MYLRVDRERGAVDHRVAFDHLARVVDADQVGDTDVLEVHPERVDPEAVEVLGIAHGDVPGDSLVEPELAEQAERRREALLAVQAFLLHGIERGKEGQVGTDCRHAEILGAAAAPAPRRSHEMTATEHIEFVHRELPYTTFDADNHLYETATR